MWHDARTPALFPRSPTMAHVGMWGCGPPACAAVAHTPGPTAQAPTAQAPAGGGPLSPMHGRIPQPARSPCMAHGCPPSAPGRTGHVPPPAPRTPPPDLPPDGLQPPNDPMPNLLIPAMPLHNSPPATDAPAATATTPTTIPGRPSLAAALPSPITPLPPVVHCAAPVDGRRSAATTPRSSVRS